MWFIDNYNINFVFTFLKHRNNTNVYVLCTKVFLKIKHTNLVLDRESTDS